LNVTFNDLYQLSCTLFVESWSHWIFNSWSWPWSVKLQYWKTSIIPLVAVVVVIATVVVDVRSTHVFTHTIQNLLVILTWPMHNCYCFSNWRRTPWMRRKKFNIKADIRIIAQHWFSQISILLFWICPLSPIFLPARCMLTRSLLRLGSLTRRYCD